MPTSRGAAIAHSKASSSANSTALTAAPINPDADLNAINSDAETEPLPYTDDEDEEQRTTKMSGAAPFAAQEDAAAALAGLGEATAPAIVASKAPSSDDSELSDVPDDEADAEGEDDGGSEDGSQEGGTADAAEEDGDSSDALGEDDDEEEEEEDADEDEEDEDEEEDDNDLKVKASRPSAAGGRRSRQEQAHVAEGDDDSEEEEDEEDEEDDEADDDEAASGLAALAGGATNVATAPLEDEDGEADETVASALPDLAAAIKPVGGRGRKPSLLSTQLIVDPADSEAATSRQPSPSSDEEDEDDAARGDATKLDADEEMKDEKAGELSKDGTAQTTLSTAGGTPLPEPQEQEDDVATDEAALRRTEAIELLTKIEISFALLRDRLYVERTHEVSRETEMLHEGTHPELIHMTALIESRRRCRHRENAIWFEEQQRFYAKMAASEERQALMSWRGDLSELRRKGMKDCNNKRRKLDREKRNIDAPRPPRQHQNFDADQIGDPELAAAAAQATKADRPAGIVGRRRAAREAQELAQLGSHIALPDLRGLEDFDAYSDLERMGILRPDVRLAAMNGMHPPPPPVQQQVLPAHEVQAQIQASHHAAHPQHPMHPEAYYEVQRPGPSAVAAHQVQMQPPHAGWAGEPAPMGYGRPMTVAEMNAYEAYQEELYVAEQQAREREMYGGHPGYGQPGPSSSAAPPHMGQPPSPPGRMQHYPAHHGHPQDSRNGSGAHYQYSQHQQQPVYDPYAPRASSPNRNGKRHAPAYEPHPQSHQHHHHRGHSITQLSPPTHAMRVPEERDIKPYSNGHGRREEIHQRGHPGMMHEPEVSAHGRDSYRQQHGYPEEDPRVQQRQQQAYPQESPRGAHNQQPYAPSHQAQRQHPQYHQNGHGQLRSPPPHPAPRNNGAGPVDLPSSSKHVRPGPPASPRQHGQPNHQQPSAPSSAAARNGGNGYQPAVGDRDRGPRPAPSEAPGSVAHAGGPHDGYAANSRPMDAAPASSAVPKSFDTSPESRVVSDIKTETPAIADAAVVEAGGQSFDSGIAPSGVAAEGQPKELAHRLPLTSPVLKPEGAGKVSMGDGQGDVAMADQHQQQAPSAQTNGSTVAGHETGTAPGGS